MQLLLAADADAIYLSSARAASVLDPIGSLLLGHVRVLARHRRVKREDQVVAIRAPDRGQRLG